jgi:hypothetical protein
MSSNSNHINPIITLDNYEEYFILYMDNELEANQVQMVESFLSQHPHLQIEMDMLMETQLPVEEISFDKTSLLSVNMPSPIAEEDLLLLMDSELEASRKKIVQLELESNPEYQKQYQQILRTKLDPSDKVIHPNKKELYRHETKVIGMAVWMRIAAALILIAAMSVLYFMSGEKETLQEGTVANQPAQNQVKEKGPAKNENIENAKTAVSTPAELAIHNKAEQDRPHSKKAIPSISLAKNQVKENKQQQELTAVNNEVETADPYSGDRVMHRTSSIETNKQSFNNKLVTVDHVDPYNNITASIQPAVFVENAASNNNHKKGSLKTFFRKATRIVGQTTGFTASGDNDEVLIGAVAVKL